MKYQEKKRLIYIELEDLADLGEKDMINFFRSIKILNFALVKKYGDNDIITSEKSSVHL